MEAFSFPKEKGSSVVGFCPDNPEAPLFDDSDWNDDDKLKGFPLLGR